MDLITPERYLFSGSTRYYTIFWDFIRYYHTIFAIIMFIVQHEIIGQNNEKKTVEKNHIGEKLLRTSGIVHFNCCHYTGWAHRPTLHQRGLAFQTSTYMAFHCFWANSNTIRLVDGGSRNVLTLVIRSTPERYLFFGFTRYYTIFQVLIRLSHDTCDISDLVKMRVNTRKCDISVQFVKSP